MSENNVSEKDDEKEEADPCKAPVKNCPHEFCHRDQIESDKPIGLPFASGLLKYIPGQEPDPYNFKHRRKLQKKQCILEKDLEVDARINACPPIIDNLLTNDPAIADEMKYIFNFILEVGDNDVGEFVNVFKENYAKAKAAKEEEEAASVAASASASASLAPSASAASASSGAVSETAEGEGGEEAPPE